MTPESGRCCLSVGEMSLRCSTGWPRCRARRPGSRRAAAARSRTQHVLVEPHGPSACGSKRCSGRAHRRSCHIFLLGFLLLPSLARDLPRDEPLSSSAPRLRGPADRSSWQQGQSESTPWPSVADQFGAVAQRGARRHRRDGGGWGAGTAAHARIGWRHGAPIWQLGGSYDCSYYTFQQCMARWRQAGIRKHLPAQSALRGRPEPAAPPCPPIAGRSGFPLPQLSKWKWAAAGAAQLITPRGEERRWGWLSVKRALRD